MISLRPRLSELSRVRSLSRSLYISAAIQSPARLSSLSSNFRCQKTFSNLGKLASGSRWASTIAIEEVEGEVKAPVSMEPLPPLFDLTVTDSMRLKQLRNVGISAHIDKFCIIQFN